MERANHGRQRSRTLVENVFVLHRDLEKICARIVWADGEPDTEIEVILNLHGHRIVGDLLDQQLDHGEIADRLNEMGIPTMLGRKWTKKTVYQVSIRRTRKANGSQPRLE